MGTAWGTHGEHEKPDEIVAEDDGDEYDEHNEDGVEGFAGHGVGDGEGEVWVICQPRRLMMSMLGWEAYMWSGSRTGRCQTRVLQ